MMNTWETSSAAPKQDSEESKSALFVSAVEHRLDEPLLLVKNEISIMLKMESGEKVMEKGPQLLEEVKGFIEDEEPPMRDKSGGSPK